MTTQTNLTAAETKALAIIGKFVDTQRSIEDASQQAVALASRQTCLDFSKSFTKPMTRTHWKDVTRPAVVSLLTDRGIKENSASALASGPWAKLFYLAGAKLLTFEGSKATLRMFVTVGDRKVEANSLSALSDFALEFDNDVCKGVTLKDASAGTDSPKGDKRGAKQTRTTKADPKLAKLAKASNPDAVRVQLMAMGNGDVAKVEAVRKGAADALVMSAKGLAGKGGFTSADKAFAEAIRVAASWTDEAKRAKLVALVKSVTEGPARKTPRTPKAKPAAAAPAA